jgi:hypothetical protein
VVAKRFHSGVRSCAIVEEERTEFIRRLWRFGAEKPWKEKFDGTTSACLREVFAVRNRQDRGESPAKKFCHRNLPRAIENEFTAPSK